MDGLTLSSLQGKSLAEKLEIAGRWAGADGPTMDGIWRTESSRGDPRYMESSAGALGHFGLMPDTTDTWSERLGFAIDPNNFDHALIAGAHTLRENLRRFGNLPDALRAYNGGWERSRWNNPETAAYVGKVLGGNADAPLGGDAAPYNPEPVPAVSPEDVLSGQVSRQDPSAGVRPEDVLRGTATAPVPTERPSGDTARFVQRLGGFRPFSNPDATSLTGMLEVNEVQTGSVVAQAREEQITGLDRFSAAVRLNTITGNLVDAIDQQIPARDPGFNYEDHMAVLEDGRTERQRIELQERSTSLEGAQQIIERQDREAELRDVAGDSLFLNLGAGLIDPVGYLLGGGLGNLLKAGGVGARVLFQEGRRAAGTVSLIGEGVAGNIAGTAIIDRLAGSYQAPEDYAANALFGALLGTAAVPFVSRSARANLPGPATQGPVVLGEIPAEPGYVRVYHSGSAGEGASGRWVSTSREYASNYRSDLPLFYTDLPEGDPRINDRDGYEQGIKQGFVFNFELTPEEAAKLVEAPREVLVQGVTDRSLQDAADNMAALVNEDEAQILLDAIAEAGPAASNEAIQAAADGIRSRRVTGLFNPIEEDHRVFSPEEPEDVDLVARQQYIDAGGFNAISDDTTRNLAAQAGERMSRIARANPDLASREHRDGFRTLNRLNLEDTGQLFLNSQDEGMRGLGMVLLESTTGLGGRRPTAALNMHMYERRFLSHIQGYERQYELYREARGVGRIADYIDTVSDGNLRRQFDIEVAEEKRRRARPDLYQPSEHRSVWEAADLLGAGYRDMGEAQIRAGTLGSANIDPTDPSYYQQAVSIAKFQKYTEAHKAAFRGIIAQQAEQIFGWDAAWSKRFGARYFESAIDKASGNYEVPVNLTHHTSSDFVEEVLESLRKTASKEELVTLDKAASKFARGGAGFTRGRLNFDVLSTYTLEDGTQVRLLDIMESDMVSLYRSYARRAAGEVALQEFGIPGKKGLDVLNAYVKVGHDAGRITNAELGAFKQISAEFLNQPFGDAASGRVGHFMDNTRLLTSVVKLGGMGITQLGEYSNGIAVLGVGRVARQISAIPRMREEIASLRVGEEVDGLLKSFEQVQGYGVGLDSWLMTRALDIKDNEVQIYSREGLGLGTKLIRSASHAQAVLSLHRITTAVQTRGMSEEIIRKTFRYVRDGKEDIALADMGLRPELRAALKANLNRIAEFLPNGEVGKIDLFAGDLTSAQRQELVGLMNRGASQIIQNTFIGETGKWAHSDFLKILLQFRTFSVTAVNKQWGRNLRNYGALKSFGIIMGAMSVALPIHMARVHAKMLGMSEEDREEYASKHLTIAALAQASVGYISSAGWASDAWDIGGSYITNLMGDDAPEWLKGTINPRGGAKSQGNFLGGVIAPAASVVESAARLALKPVVGSGEDRQFNWQALKSILPGANLPYVVPFINAIEDGIDDE